MIMRSVTVTVLLAFVAQTHTKGLDKNSIDHDEHSTRKFSDKSADMAIDEFLKRAMRKDSFRSAILDASTLGKPGHLAMKPVAAQLSRPLSILPSSTLHRHPTPSTHAKPQLHVEEHFTPTGGRRAMLSALMAAGLFSSGALKPPPTLAVDGYRQAEDIGLSDIQEQKLKCPPGTYVPQKGRWDCIEITAKADNKGGKVPSAAAVYGRIRDSDGNLVLSTVLDEGMHPSIASLGEVPKGTSEVKFVLTVIKDAPRPFTWEGFKAIYSNKNIEKQFAPFDPCELDPTSCEDDA